MSGARRLQTFTISRFLLGLYSHNTFFFNWEIVEAQEAAAEEQAAEEEEEEEEEGKKFSFFIITKQNVLF